MQPSAPLTRATDPVPSREHAGAAGRERTGVLLINLGTPDSPDPGAVRRYLREFLSDPRVLDMPAISRWLLLHLFILPFRPRTSAKAYSQIWTERGSPLRIYGDALRDAVQERLGPDYVVELGMRYQQPSLADAVSRLYAHDVSQVILFPLFPQYAASSTGSALEATLAELGRLWNVLPVATVPPFYADPGFVEALVSVSAGPLQEFRPDHVLMSYHGLPERQIKRSDLHGGVCLQQPDCCERMRAENRHCYRAQCYATSRALARGLGLSPEAYSVAFQSRLGRTPWIKPYTDVRLPELAAAGVRRLAILCPSFVADCLETLEEIGIRARESWAEAGGEAFLFVPCVNVAPRWVESVCERIETARISPTATA